MPYLPSKPDFLLDRKLAQVTTNRLITDSQIDALVAICNPPSDALRDNIAVEFERAALVLRSCRSVAGGRAKRKAFQGQLSKEQSYAKRLSNILTKLDPDLKLGLNDKFETAQNGKENFVALFEVQYLLDVFEDIDLLYPPGMKSEDVLVWVIDGLIHAIETRLAPAFNCYSPPPRRGWSSETISNGSPLSSALSGNTFAVQLHRLHLSHKKAGAAMAAPAPFSLKNSGY